MSLRSGDGSRNRCGCSAQLGALAARDVAGSCRPLGQERPASEPDLFAQAPLFVGSVASETGACGILTLAPYTGARRTQRLAGEEHVGQVHVGGVALPEPQGTRRINARYEERPCRIACRERPFMASNQSLI
jgi:hypothetical protein